MTLQAIQFETTLKTFTDRTDYIGPAIFNPDKEVRHWIKPGATSAFFYDGNASDPHITLRNFAPGELDEPNLTGTPHYPMYDPGPWNSKITWAGAGFPPTLMPPPDLCTRAQADDIARQCPGTVIKHAQEVYGTKYTFTTDPSDPRQPWMIVLKNGVSGFVGINVTQQNANGIGAPGAWVPGPDGFSFGWVSTHIPDGNDGKPHPVLYYPVINFDPTTQKVISVLTGGMIPTPMIVPINDPGPVGDDTIVIAKAGRYQRIA